MKKLKRTQLLGIGILIIGATTGFFVQNNFIGTLSGVLSAVGLALILQWIPFRKRNLN